MRILRKMTGKSENMLQFLTLVRKFTSSFCASSYSFPYDPMNELYRYMQILPLMFPSYYKISQNEVAAFISEINHDQYNLSNPTINLNVPYTASDHFQYLSTVRLNDELYSLTINHKDNLFFDALARVLLNQVLARALLNSSLERRMTDFSFLLKPELFYSNLEIIPEVNLVYRCHISRTIKYLRQATLFFLCSELLHYNTKNSESSDRLLQYIKEIFQLNVIDSQGDEHPFSLYGDGIPALGNLTKAFLEIYFSQFDRGFQEAYPKMPYYRYYHEVFVVHPPHYDEVFQPISELETFFMELSMEGEIEILYPNCPCLTCIGGTLFINNSHEMVFTKEKRIIE